MKNYFFVFALICASSAFGMEQKKPKENATFSNDNVVKKLLLNLPHKGGQKYHYALMKKTEEEKQFPQQLRFDN